MAGGGLFGGAFWATRALEVVKRNDSPGLLWKRIKLTTTRKNNAKKRLKRLWQSFSLSIFALINMLHKESTMKPCTENGLRIHILFMIASLKLFYHQQPFTCMPQLELFDWMIITVIFGQMVPLLYANEVEQKARID
uniref:Uncharacterized protein n=1 Tax=Oryza brachyantha TaxID=4533 RepID=J3NDD0_ORYBR